jgi:hypothetical protein
MRSASAWSDAAGVAVRLAALAFFPLVAAVWLVERGGWRQAGLMLVVPVGSAWIAPMLAVGCGPPLPAQASCPDCGGELGRWPGYRRLVRFRSETRRVRLARVRCRACGQTHALLPSFLLAYRRDVVDTVGAALLGAAGGLGHRPLAATLGLPAETVRGWLRRARTNQAMRAYAALLDFVYALGADPPRPPPIADPLLWLLDALASAHRLACTRFGPDIDGPWNVASALTRGQLLGTLNPNRHPRNDKVRIAPLHPQPE